MKKVEEKVIRNIKDNDLISPGDKILIALSGGADSVFLISFLNKFKKKYKITLGALHINHMMRGQAAAGDEQFCRNLCGKMNIPYYSVKKNVGMYSQKKKISFEEAGRIIRYNILEERAQKDNYTKIATAHNSNDNTETVILNLVKGTGLKGLAGIPVKRGNIIRPIISLTRAEIINYLFKNNIEFRTDESNASNRYERNFLRNEIIPQIKNRLNPSLEDAVLHSSEIIKIHLEEIGSRVEEYIHKYVRKSENELHIEIDVLEANKAVLSELIKRAIERNFSIQLSFKDITAVLTLFKDKRGSRVTLMSNLIASKGTKEVVIFRQDINAFNPIEVRINEPVKLDKKSLYIVNALKSDFTTEEKGVEYIAADDLDETFIVRKWRKGDRFFPFGMKGSKKISDFLNEKKIDTYRKEKIFVLINRERIVWVVGLRLDNRFRIKENTEKVLKICLK